MRRIPLLLIAAYLVAGCGPYYRQQAAQLQASIDPSQLYQLSQEYQSAISSDEELSPVCIGFAPSTGQYLGVLRVNGKTWSNLTRAQKDRIAKKAAYTWQEKFAASPLSVKLTVGSIALDDDLGTRIGWFIASVKGNWTYQFYGP